MTEEQLRRALFDDPATVARRLVEVDGRAAAAALWFGSFSTWDGVADSYLEDLFMRPQYRRLGLAPSCCPRWRANASTTATAG